MTILGVTIVPLGSFIVSRQKPSPASSHLSFHQSPFLCFLHAFKQQGRFSRLRRSSCGAGFIIAAQASASAILDSENHLEAGSPAPTELLACPVCFEPLFQRGHSGRSISAISKSAFYCNKCMKSYTSRDAYLDLTVTAGSKTFKEVQPAATELFRNPFVSFVYERGWRQSFSRSGFPGIDEEFKLAQGFFKPSFGGILLDVSCGTGPFSRRFLQCGAYSNVIALDYSESMLRQCYEFIKQDTSIMTENIALVRADVARLPFASRTIDAVHAGAALHCWPSPSSGVAEISRVLRPGGIFVATTFLYPSNIEYQLLKPLRQVFTQSFTSNFMYWEEAELEDLIRTCGFVQYKSTRKRSFIMLSAKMPN